MVSHTLAQVAGFLEVHCPSEWRDIELTDIGLDSRFLSPGSLWIARRGYTTHAASHPAPGARAVVTDRAGTELLVANTPHLVVEDPARIVGPLSDWWWQHPASRLTTYAVTGTNGKTTVTHVLEGALHELGARAGIIGTLGARVDGVHVPLSRTTPEAPELHALLARMEAAEVTDVAMEVSSHALTLGRVDGITYDVAVFTNLSQDHLDFHGSMESYFAAKSDLFTPQRTSHAVICVDDHYGRVLAERVRAELPVITYGRHDADVTYDINERSSTGMTLAITDRDGSQTGRSLMVGDFNAANLTAALCALVATGHSRTDAFRAVCAQSGVPGRMELVSDKPVVVVDYAHTPEAVRIVLEALRPQARRLITVIGCGGDRDSAKRPLMGATAAQLSDVVIVTDDNPRSERPADIRAAVLAGTRGLPAATEEVAGRREAIARALAVWTDGDVVAVLGKGAEQGQEVAGVVSPFDDRAVARELITEVSPW